jgi:hypothetical protein
MIREDPARRRAARVPRRNVHAALAVGVGAFAGIGTASANDACTQISGSTIWQCAGNQSSGVTFTGVSNQAATVHYMATGITITKLTTDINGPVSVSIPSSYTGSFPVTFSDPTHQLAIAASSQSAIGIAALGQTFNWSSGLPNPVPTLSLTVNGLVSAGGNAVPAISVQSTAGSGSNGSSSDGSSGSTGHFARPVTLTFDASGLLPAPSVGSVFMAGGAMATSVPAISASSIGGRGGNGGSADGLFYTPGHGAVGGSGGTVTATVNGTWTVVAPQTGVLLLSQGGLGGTGGNAGIGSGAHGGAGGNAGTVTFTTPSSTSNPFTVRTTYGNGPGIMAIAQAGNGGTGGAGDTFGSGGAGGTGGIGGAVSVAGGAWTITTSGANSPGVGAFSLGGQGGRGGDGGYVTGGGGSGGTSGNGGAVTVSNVGGTITTAGADSPGIVAQSVAGHGGAAGNDYSAVSFSASGGSAGAAGSISVSVSSAITTISNRSPGLSAQSVGGGGGTGGGGFGAFFAIGAAGGSGGAGSSVDVSSSGAITTSGADSHAIYAQSIGGAGGDGGSTGGAIAVGGKGTAASSGGAVSVGAFGTINTGMPTSQTIHASPYPICGVGCSSGIVAQSIGGGGGNGGSTSGWFSVGGTAGGGGGGGPVSVLFALGSITTRLDSSYGILAQSLGGGGGTGGMAVGTGAWVSAAVGGAGGNGGTGGAVTVTVDAVGTAQPAVTTFGNASPGVTVQSIGGGGGHGGFAIDVAPGTYASASVSIGGTGGSGGAAGRAVYTNVSDPQGCCSFITTHGDQSPALQVQSIGGGGGSGGFAISVSGSDGISGSFSMGGSGGNGGAGGGVTVWSNTHLQTQGAQSPGLQAQSMGGGGGNGGFSISGTANLGVGGLAVAVGGRGGGGGTASSVYVTNSGTIATSGTESDGIIAQSTGGGGGKGGMTVAGTFGLQPGLNFGVSVGASGGTGGSANTVSVVNTGNVTVSGADSRAIVAQSVGGGGGDAGITVSGAVSVTGEGGGISSAVALGGSGNTGGNGGLVIVQNTADLTTSSLANAADGTKLGGQGILAQSIGGGGGTGSWVGALSATIGTGGSLATSATLGGTGGAGGNATWSQVTHSGAITTYGPYSEGILASSIGGGGGHAGNIANLTVGGTPGSQGGSLVGSINIGQSGGGGGAADYVSVNSTGPITTHGVHSAAISAQSAGGGGGNAGYVFNVNFAAGSQTMAGVFGITQGGSGGSGRSGGEVFVSSNGALTTQGDNSPGIQAQSIGGGGGNAAYTVSLSLGQPGSQLQSIGLTGAIGGSGGTGATSGPVTVTNKGSITTGLLAADGSIISGGGSHGIVAVSIGGGGGNAALTVATAALVTAKTSVTVGGDGGTGGHSGSVTVSNDGAILVRANAAAGLVARSIGGGGGDSQATSVGVGVGDNPFSNKSVGVDVAVGNQGAGGGDGAAVTVTNTGAITTSRIASSTPPPSDPPLDYRAPIGSYGIFAQSVGGGGGAGGSASVLIPNFTAKDSSLNVSISVGGRGGAGGIGQTVQVTNSGVITTYQSESYGIAAQSVGGGGGKGGAAASVTGFLYNTSNAANIGIAVGGEGGTGNNAGTVAVTNTGQVETFGTSAHAIFAQSIGGGGGDGGSAGAYALGYNASATSNWQGTLNVEVGGSGGGSGSGNTVTVHNTTTIKTFGDDAAGIFAQSVGGGGGTGGGASPLSLFPLSTLNISVGGKGGAAGNGGAVNVSHNNWGLVTEGANAPAIYAQSVGGGGGRGGVGIYVPLFTVPWGGAGGSSGSGGAVNVYVGYAGLSTHGSGRSYGIFAQSVGGGGGETGGLGFGIIDTIFPNPPPAMVNIASGSGADAGNGNGGSVNVKLDGSSLATTGNDAIGIFAQSVGGGGGVGGQTTSSASSCQTSPCGYNVGSSLGTGNTGPVSVELVNGARITTSGQYSHGIFAQTSAGNASTAGNVSVSVNSSVTATGDSASGIFANSSSGGTNGTITITIGSGATVSGGTGNAAGIRLIDGSANTITNAGLITSVGGDDGVAIRVDRSAGAFSTVTTTVTNTGTIIGEHLGGPHTTLNVNNPPTGTLVTGPRMILGDGGRLTNHGLMEIGGPGGVRTTTLSGTLVQGPSGVLRMAFHPHIAGQGPAASLLTVTGDATLAGSILMRPLHVGVAGLGRHSVELVRTTGTLSTTGLAVVPSVVAQYELGRPSAQSLAVSYDIDFANPTVSAGLRSAQLSVASYLKTLHGSGELLAGFDYLLGFGTVEDYGKALDRLSPEPYATNLWTTALAAARFSDAMLDCRARTDAQRLVDGESCLAMGLTGWKHGRDDSSAARGYDVGVVAFTISGEKRLSPGWVIGGGLGYDNLFTRATGHIWNTNSNLFRAGAFVRHDTGGLALTTAVYGGGGSSSVRRYTSENTATHGGQSLLYAGTTLRAEYPVKTAGGTLRLRFDLNAVHVASDSLREDGALGRLAVNSASETLLSVRPMIEWSTELPRGDYTLRPRIGLGLTQYLSDPSPAIRGSFLEASASQPSMRVTSKVQRTYGDVVLGLDIAAVGGMVFGGSVFAQVAESAYLLGGGFHMHVPF